MVYLYTVANGKIKEPYDLKDPSLEESPLALNSLNNITVPFGQAIIQQTTQVENAMAAIIYSLINFYTNNYYLAKKYNTYGQASITSKRL